jgi:hypothetical protein
MTYKKIAQCKICRSPIGAKIDRALVKREPHKKIIEDYGHEFGPEGLNRHNLQLHWKHMKEAAEYIAATALTKKAVQPALPAALSDERESHSVERQTVFTGLVKERINEVEILERLVQSGLQDLDKMTPDVNDEGDEKEDGWKILQRDRVRRSTASITVESAKVKQIASQVNDDQHRLEKSRLVFRMFELFGKALQACPMDYRSSVGAELKDLIRRDDEVNALMKAQSVGREGAETAVIVPKRIDDDE